MDYGCEIGILVRTHAVCYDLLQRQIQDFPKVGGGMGRRGYGYFILGHFIVGHIIQCMNKMLTDKMLMAKHQSNMQGRTKCWPFYGTGRTKCNFKMVLNEITFVNITSEAYCVFYVVSNKKIFFIFIDTRTIIQRYI